MWSKEMVPLRLSQKNNQLLKGKVQEGLFLEETTTNENSLPLWFSGVRNLYQVLSSNWQHCSCGPSFRVQKDTEIKELYNLSLQFKLTTKVGYMEGGRAT